MDGRLASSEKRKVVLTRVLMYTTGFCPYCRFVKRLFDDLRVPYQEVRVDLDPEKRREMMEISQRRTVPQVFVGDRHIGGCDDTQHAARSGQLKIWLEEVGIYV